MSDSNESGLLQAVRSVSNVAEGVSPIDTFKGLDAEDLVRITAANDERWAMMLGFLDNDRQVEMSDDLKEIYLEQLVPDEEIRGDGELVDACEKHVERMLQYAAENEVEGMFDGEDGTLDEIKAELFTQMFGLYMAKNMGLVNGESAEAESVGVEQRRHQRKGIENIMKQMLRKDPITRNMPQIESGNATGQGDMSQEQMRRLLEEMRGPQMPPRLQLLMLGLQIFDKLWGSIEGSISDAAGVK